METKVIDAFVTKQTANGLISKDHRKVNYLYLPSEVSPEAIDDYVAVKVTIALPERKVALSESDILKLITRAQVGLLSVNEILSKTLNKE